MALPTRPDDAACGPPSFLVLSSTGLARPAVSAEIVFLGCHSVKFGRREICLFVIKMYTNWRARCSSGKGRF